MNVINDDVLHFLLTSKHCGKVCSFRILDWHIDDNIVKAGNNYSTQVSRLIVRYQSQTPKHEQDDTSSQEGIFFIKVPANAPLYELIKQFGSYDNEVAMYTEILPQMHIVNDDDEDEYFTPRHFYSDEQNSLVLEDLSQYGYRCADRVEQLDFEHCFYTLRCLAKFHALSVNLETTVGLPELIKRDPYLDAKRWSEESIAAFKSQIPMFVDSLPQNLKDQYPEMVTHLLNQASERGMTGMRKDQSTAKFNVLNHGDFWTNNIMFKYDKYGSIKKVKLIDFQLTSWSSPAKDLIYFIITSVKFELYRTHFPLLLRIYLDTLNKVLSRLDCPTCSMSSLLDDIDNMYPFALVVLYSVLPIILSDPDDPLNIEEMSKDDKFQVGGMAKAYQQKRFREISAKWFEHFAQKGSICIDEQNTSITSSNDHEPKTE